MSQRAAARERAAKVFVERSVAAAPNPVTADELAAMKKELETVKRFTSKGDVSAAVPERPIKPAPEALTVAPRPRTPPLTACGDERTHLTKGC